MFCPYSINNYNNSIESSWNCVTVVKKNVCVKIFLLADIPARKAALGRNYFSNKPNNSRRSLQKGELPIPSSFHVSYSVSVGELSDYVTLMSRGFNSVWRLQEKLFVINMSCCAVRCQNRKTVQEDLKFHTKPLSHTPFHANDRQFLVESSRKRWLER